MKAEKQEEGEGASGCRVKVGGCRCLALATKSARIEGQVAVEWTRENGSKGLVSPWMQWARTARAQISSIQ